MSFSVGMLPRNNLAENIYKLAELHSKSAVNKTLIMNHKIYQSFPPQRYCAIHYLRIRLILSNITVNDKL